MSSSVIESACENENQNLSSSDNKTLPDSQRKRKRRCIQLLCAKECSEEEPPESSERKLDTVETGRNKYADDTEEKFEIAE